MRPLPSPDPRPATTAGRIRTLDVLRGLAVMGIVAANLPAFALPEAAYFAPAAAGGTAPADIAAWFATYVLVEGKMRGLFSLLFGASALLVIQRAEAGGRSGAAVHYRRMAVLLGIGLVHLYALWWGDILVHYALCGAILFLFAGLPTRALLLSALLLIAWSALQAFGLWAALLQAQADGGPAARRLVTALQAGFGTPPPARIAAEVAAYRGGYASALWWRWRTLTPPLTVLPVLGPETLATMLLGMAGLRSGFLTGAWPRSRYLLCAAAGLGLTLPAYAAVALHAAAGGFRLADVVLGAQVVPALLRWPAILGYAALGVLLASSAAWPIARIAATGRMALSNYLATTVAMTALFYGLGLFARLSRAELALFLPAIWAAMLVWSPWWLARHRHGPAEWLWRRLSGGRTAEPR